MPGPDESGSLGKVLSLQVWLTALLSAVASVAVLYYLVPALRQGHPLTAAVLRELALAFLTASAVLALWELGARRAFANEILAKVRLSQDLEASGIRMVTGSFQDSAIPWQDLFARSRALDVLMAYGHSWISNHGESVKSLLNSSGAKLRVVLPDPSNDSVMAELAHRWDLPAEKIKGEIKEAAHFFQQSAKASRGVLELRYTPHAPVFTFYRFERGAVVAFYNNTPGKRPVPTLVCRSEGPVFDFLSDEMKSMLKIAQPE